MGTTFHLRSAVLDDVREVNIWLPPDYDRFQRRYPVVYLIDGGLQQDFHHIAGLAQLASLSWTFGPFILVGIERKARAVELTPTPADARYIRAFPGSGGSGRFRAFLQREVIPFVEQHYRTEPRRAVMGESLAGLFVIDTLLNAPPLFQDYVAVSPSLWWDDRRMLTDAAVRLCDAEGPQRRLYLAVADEGGTLRNGVDRLREVAAGIPNGRLEIRFSNRGASSTHSTIYHGAAEEVLRWLYPMPPDNPGPTPWFMIEGASPPERPAPPAPGGAGTPT